ncbi:MAG: hypothetical protein AB7I04_23985 [Pseudomonadales bacterium]
MSRFTVFLVAGILASSLGGCASTTTSDAKARPTHYWEANVPAKQYNADNAACEAKTQTRADGQLDPNSPSFEAYRDCMISEGYSLRTY